ncbi:hypothetical protein [Sphingorhabdus sp. EL138]|uniref:DUF7946 domain-containing protein n=1 Tax=Sphingorhabdus sp. EL138 TaxID=2073156 RepID=UPI000D698560|nr:hypothetical protein [Sphingorhabdus sp. EL138]
MSNPKIKLTYDGGDADQHAIDAKLFGQSLQGIDKLVSDALIIITQERLPKRGERAPLIMKAKEPESGSLTVAGFFQEAAVLLPLGLPLISTIGVDIISHYVTSALSFFSGKDENMEVLTKAMAKMHHDIVVANDRADERRHIEAMGMQDILRQSIASNEQAARNYVAPVGPSVGTASFYSGNRDPVIIGVEEADKVREFDSVEWLPVGKMGLETDGFKFHTNGLSVKNPDRDGFLMAEVVDPVFEQESNPYTIAAQKKAAITVLARRGYKGDKLSKIQIVDFVEELGDDAA